MSRSSAQRSTAPHRIGCRLPSDQLHYELGAVAADGPGIHETRDVGIIHEREACAPLDARLPTQSPFPAE